MNILTKFSTLIRRKKAETMMHCVRKQKLTYLSEKKIQNLINLVLNTESNEIPGVIIEAGCALGGSSIVIATAKKKNRSMAIYDVFEMIPPPSEKDGSDVHERYKIIASGKSQGIEVDDYYGYISNLYEKVIDNFQSNKIELKRNNISLVKGLVQDTLHPNTAVCLAHIDVDWYDPVMTCLTRIEPKLSIGGIIVLDDYQDWSGCHQATDEFFSDKQERFEFNSNSGSLVVRKIR